ncbi:hypothetical protein HDU97_000574 [Phlyctochytrium planicorne]|nr:hypothetical protein HDU97_000574 [Phlyctochytrium planicorne]
MLQGAPEGQEQFGKKGEVPVRHFASKGDLHKAKVVAKQIAHLRSASDRNFEGSVMIATRAQLMVSNHKVNRAEIEAIKGIRYANIEDDISTFGSREMKYHQRLTQYEEMEKIMNEGLDEAYENAEDARKKREYFEVEADHILKDALAPKQSGGRYYITEKRDPDSQSVTVHFRLYEPPSQDEYENNHHRDSTATEGDERHVSFPDVPQSGKISSNNPVADASSSRARENETLNRLSSLKLTASRPSLTESVVSMQYAAHGASLEIPTLDLSVDMLKRLMIRDPYLLSQLALRKAQQPSGNATGKPGAKTVAPKAKDAWDVAVGNPSTSPFLLGRVDPATGKFVPYDFVMSLKQCGVKKGSEIAVLRMNEAEQ